MNPFQIRDTYELIKTIELIKKPARYLVDTLFPKVLPTATTSHVAVEYMNQGRQVAPYVIKGGKGVNVSREGSYVKLYSAPMVAPRRTIGLRDIELRQFGEMPVVSALTPEDRAAQMQARDLIDLQDMVANRKAQMAAEILQTGKVIMEGLADDGETILRDEIKFADVTIKTKDWTNANADIFGDLEEASEEIQEKSGLIPTLMICGKNIAKYLTGNKVMREWLLSANTNAIKWLNFEPKYLAPQVRFIGYVSALNLEIVSYTETYKEGDVVKPFIDPDTCIICVPGRGRQLHGAITLVENHNWVTYAAPLVPCYTASDDAQTTSLTLYSRFLLVPEEIGDFITLKVGA